MCLERDSKIPLTCGSSVGMTLSISVDDLGVRSEAIKMTP